MNPFDHSRAPHPLASATRLAGRSIVLVACSALASLFLVTLYLVSGFLVTAAGAQDPLDCRESVVDTSGTVDLAAVDAALSRIDRGRIGSDAAVLIRVWENVPDADLAAAVDDVVAQCVGDPEFGIAPNAVVLGLSVGDGLTDVLVGGSWTAAVPDADRLRTDVMGPPLAGGDVTGGLVAALEAMAGGVAALPVAEDPDPAGDPGADEPQPGATVGVDDGSSDDAVIASEPVPEPEPSSTDDGSPFTVVLGLLGLGACGGAVVLVQRQRAMARERDRLGRKVEPAFGRLRVLRERHHQLVEQADVWYRTGAGRTRTDVGAAVRQVETAGKATDRAAGLLHGVIPDGVDGADRDQAAKGQERVAELLRVLDAHAKELDELAAIGAHLDHLEVALPAKAELLAHELPEIRQAANQRVGEGWTVESVRERLTAIQAAIDEVKEAEALLEVDLLDLSDRLERAEATLFSVDHELQVLSDRAGSLGRWRQQLVEAADHELGRVDELRRQLATAALTSAPDSWRWAANHPDDAVAALERADANGEWVVAELIPAQRFDDAGRALDAAGLEIVVADDLLDQLDDLLVDIERARAEAPGVVERVANALEVLEATVDRYRGDLSPGLSKRRAELAPVVDGLRAELAGPKPNHIRVVETAEETDRLIDRLLVAADEQHQRAEALRHELDRQRARADRALARARRALGWQRFPSADGSAIDRLEAELASPPNDLAAAVDGAADIADAALRLQEQIIARRRRRDAAVTIGTGPPILGGGWNMGGSTRRSRSPARGTGRRPGARSSGGRSFGGRRRSSGGRSLGPRRSTGRF